MKTKAMKDLKPGPAKATILKKEAEILHAFFSTIAVSARLTQGRTWTQGAQSHPLYEAALATLRDRRAKGYTGEDLRQAFLLAQESGTKTLHLHEILPEVPPSLLTRSLVTPQTTFTHPAMKTFLPPCWRGDSLVSEGRVVPDTTFSLQDLMAYYLGRLVPEAVQMKQLQSALRYFLDQGIELDTLLHAIDLWRDADNSRARGQDPWTLGRYFSEARAERAWRLEGARSL